MYKSKSISYEKMLEARDTLVDNIYDDTDNGKVRKHETIDHIYEFLKRIGFDFNSVNEGTVWDIARKPNVTLTSEDSVRSTDATIDEMFPYIHGSVEAKVRELVGKVLWGLGIDISNSGDCAEWVVTKTKPAAKEEASMKDSVVYKYDDMERLESALTHHDFGCTVSYHSEETFHIAMGTANMYATKVVLSWDGRIATAKGYIGDVNTFKIHTVCDLPTMGD